MDSLLPTYPEKKRLKRRKRGYNEKTNQTTIRPNTQYFQPTPKKQTRCPQSSRSKKGNFPTRARNETQALGSTKKKGVKLPCLVPISNLKKGALKGNSLGETAASKQSRSRKQPENKEGPQALTAGNKIPTPGEDKEKKPLKSSRQTVCPTRGINIHKVDKEDKHGRHKRAGCGSKIHTRTKKERRTEPLNKWEGQSGWGKEHKRITNVGQGWKSKRIRPEGYRTRRGTKTPYENQKRNHI